MFAIILISLVSLTISFFCSLVEACIYSVSRSRIESLRRDGHASGRRLAQVRSNIDEAIAAILILNTIANSGGAAWASALVEDRFGDWRAGVSAVFVFAGLFTGSVLFFSEIIPKTIGVKFADRLAPYLALPLTGLILLLKPLVRLCVGVTRMWGKDVHLRHPTEEDILNLVSLGQRGGAILPNEARWVANALRLNDLTAYDLMTPGSVVARVPETLTLRHTTIDAQHWRFSRIPVCADDNPDRIVGVVYRQKVFDGLAKDHFDARIGDLMDAAEFVSEKTAAHELLDQFLTKRRHLFCVRDDNGAFTGVVTLEDVLEALLGAEIVDEKDLHVDMQELARQRRQRLLRQSREFIESHPEDGAK